MASLLVPCHIHYADTRMGHYVVQRAEPSPAQKNLLQIEMTIRFTPELTTVGSAINHLLIPQGYRLGYSKHTTRAELDQLLSFPLPKIHRSLGPMSLKHILETLAGPAWYVVHDPLNRMISFERCSLDRSSGTVR